MIRIEENLNRNIQLEQHRNILGQPQFLELARAKAELYGSVDTLKGTLELVRDLRKFTENERISPEITRIAIGLYEKGLREAGIEQDKRDRVRLHYHFTDKYGADEINKSQMLGKDRLVLTDPQGPFGIISIMKSLFEVNPSHVYVTTRVTPEKATPTPRNPLMGILFKNTVATLNMFGFNSLTTGLSQERMQYYFEILTTDDKLFSRTRLYKFPIRWVDSSRTEEPLKLGEHDNYAVLGPYKNTENPKINKA